MKVRHKVLVLTAARYRSAHWRQWIDRQPFFPGSRLKNYQELLTGFGIPHEVVELTAFTADLLTTGDGWRYTAAIIACPLTFLSTDQLAWLDAGAREGGISLLTDSFLLHRSPALALFGLSSCGGRRFGPQQVSGADRAPLFATNRRPFSSRGPDSGLRPTLRLLLQSHASRRITASDDAQVFASFAGGTPAIVRRQHGKAVNTCLNFEPGRVLHRGNRLHGVLRDILTTHCDCPAVAVHLEGAACLRMDDPGSCERAYLSGYDDGVLSAETWQSLLQLLAGEDAHLNVAYVPGWVDDGDANRGKLTHCGEELTERMPGRVYPAWEVSYSRREAPDRHDYAAEYRAIRAGVDAGVLSIVSHGLTHLTTDVPGWLRAGDRYTRKEWFREFREMVSGKSVSADELRSRLQCSREELGRAFGTMPELVVPSAHEHAAEVVVLAQEAGYHLFSARETVFLWPGNIVANRKVGSFYAEDLADGLALLECGYPVVFVFHDYDIYRGGADWLREKIQRLRAHGAERMLPMTTWATGLMARLEVELAGRTLHVTLDLTACPRPSGEEALPLRIGAAVAGCVTREGLELAVRIDGERSFVEVPLTTVKDGRLSLSLTLAPRATGPEKAP